MKVWSWRDAVQKSNLPSTSKFLLFNLSLYMNEKGQGCFPSIRRQAKDTGFSTRTICTHLKIAVREGFLIRKKHGFGDQRWARNEYEARFPEGVVIGSTPYEEAVEPNDIKVLNEVQSNTPFNTSGVKTPPLPPKGKKQEGVLKKDKGKFDIISELNDRGLDNAKLNAPGWDIYYLAEIYNEGVVSGKRRPPDYPNAAFPAWCKSYTKGNPPG